MGDDVLADYRAGRLTPRRAQELVARGLRQTSGLHAQGDRITIEQDESPSAALAPNYQYDSMRVARDILRVTNYILTPRRNVDVEPNIREACLRASDGDADALATVLTYCREASLSTPVLRASLNLKPPVLHIIARDQIEIRARLKQLKGATT
jgi:hypothetical protein